MGKKKKDKVKQLGTMSFNFYDFRKNKYNESVYFSVPLYGDKEDEALSLETYWMLCRHFAASMGFSEKSIDEWFGTY